MAITAADLLRAGLTLAVLVVGYEHAANVLRFLLPGRVRHRMRPDVPEPRTPLTESLHQEGFRYLGLRQESVLGLHRRSALAYSGPAGRVVDLTLSGRLQGSYVMTWFEGDRCALTRCGGGWGVSGDRYQSRVIRGVVSLSELLSLHRDLEASVSLGYPHLEVGSAADRLALAERWYRVHARRELLLPAALQGSVLVALVAFAVYLWL